MTNPNPPARVITVQSESDSDQSKWQIDVIMPFVGHVYPFDGPHPQNVPEPVLLALLDFAQRGLAT